jgi:hypothetical protein
LQENRVEIMIVNMKIFFRCIVVGVLLAANDLRLKKVGDFEVQTFF